MRLAHLLVGSLGALFSAACFPAAAATPEEILATNTRAIVYLQIEDASGGEIDHGTGFIVSHDGYVVTAAHLKADPTQKMWATIGQRDGTRFRLSFRDLDPNSDVALWQFQQSATCKYTATLSSKAVKVLDRALVLGFPGKSGLTPSRVSINNLTSERGFYKADGFLNPGNSGGPVFSENGHVIGIVQGGTLPGTENNDIAPIAPALALIRKHGVNAGIDAAVPFENSCYSFCRAAAHGVEKWTSEKEWGPYDSGELSGGHNQTDECNKITASAVALQPGAQIELYPGQAGKWETVRKDLAGQVHYIYYCKGIIRTGPIYKEAQSPACGLWN